MNGPVAQPNGVIALKRLLPLFALVLFALPALAADPPPPAGTVVRAQDDGKLYVAGADGKFRPHEAAPAAPCTVCDPCKCAAGVCPACPATAATGTDGALAEVNAKRAARGLPPFAYDEGLTRAAQACAAFRAERGIAGHSANDFGFLPAGVRADAAGCAAWPAHMGWGSCCAYENWSHAGAAWATGRDGLRYMHLLCRNGAQAGSAAGMAPVVGGQPVYLPAPAASSCPGGNCPAPASGRPRYAIPVK
jgi:hypothetical protein